MVRCSWRMLVQKETVMTNSTQYWNVLILRCNGSPKVHQTLEYSSKDHLLPRILSVVRWSTFNRSGIHREHNFRNPFADIYAKMSVALKCSLEKNYNNASASPMVIETSLMVTETNARCLPILDEPTEWPVACIYAR